MRNLPNAPYIAVVCPVMFLPSHLPGGHFSLLSASIYILVETHACSRDTPRAGLWIIYQNRTEHIHWIFVGLITSNIRRAAKLA